MLLYSRDLPGGGMVMINGEQKGPSAYRGYISVERRSDPERRVGHQPPVIAEVSAATQISALRILYDIASDNLAIARGISKWETQRRVMS
ncbi:MAG: hypothetical protein ABR543_08040 [Gemmatimonadaceae bacterium]